MKLHLDGEPIGDVKRMSLAPGDVIVVECRAVLNAQQVHAILDQVRSCSPDHKVLIGDQIAFAVVRPADTHEGSDGVPWVHERARLGGDDREGAS